MTRPMRVLLAHNRYREPGGEERHVELLRQALPAHGVEVRMYEQDSDAIGGSLAARAVTAAQLTYRPAAARELDPILRDWRPDVVHFHNLMPLLTPAALRAAKRSGAAVVLTAHNYRLVCPAGTLLRNGAVHDDCVEGSSLACGLRNARGSWPESVAYGTAIELQRRLGLVRRYVDAYVAPSRFLARILARGGYPADRLHVVPYGVPAEESQDGGGAHVLYAGRLSREKGILTLLDAARRAPEVRVAVAGAGPEEAALERAGLENMRYLGLLNADALRSARRDARFTVVPSECHDVLPFSALESLAAARPVVATSLGGLPEIVEAGRSGTIVPPKDPGALAAALTELWDAPALVKELGAGAHVRARSQFDLGAQTGKIVDLYRSLLR